MKQIRTELISTVQAESLGCADPQGERLEEARAEFQAAWEVKVAKKERRVKRLREAGWIWIKRGQWCMQQVLSVVMYFPLVAALGYISKSARWGLKAFVVVIGILGLGCVVAWTVGFGLAFAAERLRVKEIKHL